MKSTSAATVALAALHARDPRSLEKAFDHLTPSSLERIDAWIKGEATDFDESDCFRVVAKGVIRRKVFKCLRKYSDVSSPETVETALKFHTLPSSLQQELAHKYGGEAPMTWFEAMNHLKSIATDNSRLWQLLLDHPMTSYVPMQCANCGHVVPDDSARSEFSDADVGISEEEPDGSELKIRGGWYRGVPRPPNIIRLDCPKCHSATRWYRSGHPQVILTPEKWGRLCGEQEELRLSLANYLEIPIRSILPLDWDHIWSEIGVSKENDGTVHWDALDPNESNFCCRLDEGIGSWSGVWAVHPDPAFCQDVTCEYLSCRDNSTMRGRADTDHESSLRKYKETVDKSRSDRNGDLTQASTIYGYALQRAGLESNELVTKELQEAARDFGSRGWWEV